MDAVDPIDVVILWVDVSDPAWRAARAEALGGSSESRYTGANNDWDSLRYLLRSIERYCPWARRVHLVTPDQVPRWLVVDHPRISVVDQRDLLPPDASPSFNSMAVEVNLDRIPGLAPTFVYFNDDMLVLKETSAEDLVPRGRPAGFAVQNALSASNDWSHWVLNAVGAVNAVFDKRSVMRARPWQWFSLRYGRHLVRNVALLPWGAFTGFFEPHVPMVLHTETFRQVRCRLPELIEATSRSRVRSLTDVSPFLFRYWQLCTGDFTPVSPDAYGRFFEVGIDTLDAIDAHLRANGSMFVCLNDGPAAEEEGAHERLHAILDARFPAPSTFERARVDHDE
ncbi:Stealth CR1 domain-containing protein [Microbacterium sp. NPDC058389]|uniref:stealth family protein n=1 Tax=Microbacterium sp. NPDC058389 TaxID=3346475 RepID=UPI00364CCD46